MMTRWILTTIFALFTSLNLYASKIKELGAPEFARQAKKDAEEVAKTDPSKVDKAKLYAAIIWYFDANYSDFNFNNSLYADSTVSRVLIKEEMGFAKKITKGKPATLVFNICTLMIKLGSLDENFEMREQAYNACADMINDKFGLDEHKVVLEPRDIEQVHNRFPLDRLKAIILGKGAFSDHPERHRKLCMKNPLGDTTFNEDEKDFYCRLNLGFRTCNLIVQSHLRSLTGEEKVDPSMVRERAFTYCSNSKHFPLKPEKITEFRAKLGDYLTR